METRFISELIEVEFDEEPALLKKPGCPDRFRWGDDLFEITDVLAEWHDYRRRGRMRQNMRASRLARAERSGSWGVGRDYYRVRTAGGRIFEIYFDRAPKDSDDRSGTWVLDREVLSDGRG